MRKLALVTLSLALLLAAGAAEAAPLTRGGTSLSAWGVLDPGPGGYGLGLRLSVPVVPEGILNARVRDEFVLEAGLDFVHYDYVFDYYPYRYDYSWNGFLPVVGMAWNFWFSDKLGVYPKLDVGYWIGSYSGWDDAWNGYYYTGYGYYYSRPTHDRLFIQGALGLIVRLKAVALRVEAGSGLLRLGAGWQF